MSKDNISLNDILEEFSPDGQKKVEKNNTNTDNQPKEIPVEPPKTLEQLEMERLQAISKGELSDSAINYATFTNKPNKIIQNPTESSNSNQYYTKGVIKINSRPDRKETNQDSYNKSPNNDDIDNENSNEHKKIDSRNSKAKLESSNLKKDYARSHNDISNEDFAIMSEKISKAKAKKKHQIEELNSNHSTITTSTEDTPKDTTVDTPKKAKKKDKKSLWNRIVDYYTIPVEEDFPTDDTDLNSNVDVTSTTSATSDIQDTTNDIQKDKKSNRKLFNTKKKEKVSKAKKVDTPIADTPKVESTPIVDNSSSADAKKKETFKEFLIDLFTDKEKASPRKHETFRERMTEFFNVQEDETIETTQSLDLPTENTSNPIDSEVPNNIDNLLNNLVDNTITEKPPVTENIIKDTPIAEKPSVTENIIKDTPIAEKPPVAENIIKDTPIAEETPVAESIIKDTPTEKKPNVFKRIKNFFLMEEIMEMQSSNDDDTEDTPTDTNLDDILENSTIDTPPIEETPKEENTSQPIEEPKEVIKPVEEKSKVEDTSKDIESKSSEVNTSVPDDDYIIPFSEETSNDAIDIPIEEPIKYKHFWQDPDFNPIDRIKSYVEEASEKHRNRKRSGEIHIEIKSTPDTSILFSNVEKGVLEEQKIIKSREEFKKQVLNGEYDNYEETLNKSNLEQDEHTFEDTSVNDFNSYEDKSKVKQYIAEMKTNLLVRIIITLVLCILSLYITLANDLNLPIFDTLKTTTSASGYLMVQSAIGLVAILTSVKAVFSGIAKLFTRKADSDSFASIGIVSAFIGSIVTFFMGSSLVEEQLLNIYMPIALIGLLANLSGKMLIIKREEHNFKFISRDKDKFGTFCMQDDYNAEKITKGLVEDYPVTVYKKKSKFASDFIKYTYSYDMADRFSKFAVPTISVIALIVSIIASIVYNKSFDMVIPVGIISIFSMLISFCSCFSIPLYINSMLYRVSEKYAKRDGALLGYQAVEDFYDTNSIILNASDIFPKGSVNISALKLFSNAKVDETLIYAISLAKNMNSILAPTLLDMLDGNWDMLCDVENCSYEDGLGICGWIDNKRVLMGNRELMEAHNIENLPTKSKESELVGSKKDGIYISVSGNLALMLIVDIVPNKKIKQDLHTLENSKISIAVNSCDFLVSVNKIEYLFGINPEKVKVIPYELYQETKEYFKEKPKCSSSIVTNGDIGIITKLLVSTKRIHKMSILGNMLHAVACIVGIIIGISFISMGAFRELTPTMILLYNFICSGIILLICKWQKF